jgi:hypothetical protein
MGKIIDKSCVGKYVCYAAPDGSFTFGRILDQGWQMTIKGDREVFILTDQITCRVARNSMELASIESIRNRLESGREPAMLPDQFVAASRPRDYQQFGQKQLPDQQFGQKQLPEAIGQSLPVVVSTHEGSGLVPALEKTMPIAKSAGLPMMQRVGRITSSVDGHIINFVLRRYGYATTVRRESLGQDDVIDVSGPEFAWLTDGEVFIAAMQAKLKRHLAGMFESQKRKALES